MFRVCPTTVDDERPELAGMGWNASHSQLPAEGDGVLFSFLQGFHDSWMEYLGMTDFLFLMGWSKIQAFWRSSQLLILGSR